MAKKLYFLKNGKIVKICEKCQKDKRGKGRVYYIWYTLLESYGSQRSDRLAPTQQSWTCRASDFW